MLPTADINNQPYFSVVRSIAVCQFLVNKDERLVFMVLREAIEISKRRYKMLFLRRTRSVLIMSDRHFSKIVCMALSKLVILFFVKHVFDDFNLICYQKQ